MMVGESLPFPSSDPYIVQKETENWAHRNLNQIAIAIECEATKSYEFLDWESIIVCVNIFFVVIIIIGNWRCVFVLEPFVGFNTCDCDPREWIWIKHSLDHGSCAWWQPSWYWWVSFAYLEERKKKSKFFLKPCFFKTYAKLIISERKNLPSGREQQGFYRQKEDIRLESHTRSHRMTIYLMLHHHILCWLKPQAQRN